MPVAEIKVRNDAGSEFCFGSVEEFADAIQSGGVTSAWEVFHAAGQRWLPVTRHPVFAARKQVETTTEQGE